MVTPFTPDAMAFHWYRGDWGQTAFADANGYHLRAKVLESGEVHSPDMTVGAVFFRGSPIATLAYCDLDSPQSPSAKAWCERTAREHAAEHEGKPAMLLCRPDQVETARKLLSAPLGAAMHDAASGATVQVMSGNTGFTFTAKRAIRLGDMVTSNDVEWSDEPGEEVQMPSPPETSERELKPKRYPHISVGLADPPTGSRGAGEHVEERAATEAQPHDDMRMGTINGFPVWLPLEEAPLGKEIAKLQAIEDGIREKAKSSFIIYLSRLLRLGPDATREQCEGRIKALLTEPMSICAEEQELRRKAVMRESDARRCCERAVNDVRRLEGENKELRAALADAVLKGRR